MPDVFLSYNREDQAAARRFAEAFEAQGLDVWWDTTLRAGEAYDEVTETALRMAKAVVVLWSKKSVASRWVRAEATLADRNKTLVPCMIEPCERPIMFELTQTAELGHWSGDLQDRAWLTFLGDVRRFVARAVPASTAVSVVDAVSTPSIAVERGARPSIAILPLANRSGHGEDDMVAMSMVEDLAAALAAGRAFKVVSGSALNAYRGTAMDIRRIGRDLGVRYLLEGNLRRTGRDLRLAAQLVEAETGAILWTQRFDRPLAEFAVLQEDVIVRICDQLGVQMRRIEIERALRMSGVMTGWQAVMIATRDFNSANAEKLVTALSAARSAVALAPRYAYAHAALGVGIICVDVWCEDGLVDADEATTSFERALALDGDNPSVLWTVALGLAWSRRGGEGLSHALRAVHLNPTLAPAQLALGCCHLDVGDHEKALLALDTHDQLAPESFMAVHVVETRLAVLLAQERIEEACQVADTAWSNRFQTPHIYFGIAAAFLAVGQEQRAHEALRRCRTLESPLSSTTWRKLVLGDKGIRHIPLALAEKCWALMQDTL